MLKVIDPGLASTIQDLGRPGYFHLGIPIGGAMDQFAAQMANRLLGNNENAALIEAVFLAPKLEFETDTVIAVTGADLPIELDGEAVESWTALAVKAGQTLSFGYLRGGARIYIAVAGGIDVPSVLGSRSTYLIGAFGGFEGRALATGDRLPLGDGAAAQSGKRLAPQYRPPLASAVELRVLPGLYWHRLSATAGDNFFADSWNVAPEADRMGYRFRGGRALEFVPREQPFGAGADPSNIVDSSYAYGSIQVPGGTEPIVLHRDAVSAGGYFTLGAVISADMDLIAQLQPNMQARFVKVTMDQALAARAARTQFINDARAALQ